MKLAGLCLVAHAAFFDICHAFSSSAQTPGSLKLGLARSQDNQPLLRSRHTKTDHSVLSKIKNAEANYLINLTVGTPPQALTLSLDTGSSDLWLPGVYSAACQQGNCTNGEYNMSASCTAEMFLEDEFLVKYVDSTQASGSYINDTVRIGEAIIENATVGYASILTGVNTGIMGIGYPWIEGTTERVYYDNLPQRLVDDGIINTMAYSLWLDDLDASSGSILFGAIDRSKYVGDLTIVDFWPETGYDIIFRFLVMLSGVTAVSDSGSDALGSSSFPFTALLDSGTSGTFLPDDLALEILEEVGGTYYEADGTTWVPCDLVNSTGYYSFEFGGGPARVNVSMSDLVFLDLRAEMDNTLCEFGIVPMGNVSTSVILGDTFLRSAYVVYDLANNQAAIAQTNFHAKPEHSDIVTFASLSATVPCATLAPGHGNSTGAKGAVTTTLASFSAAAGFSDVPTASAYSVASSSGSSSDHKKSVRIVGAAVGGAAAGVLLLGSGAYVWRTVAAKKKKRYAQVDATPAGADAGHVDEAKVLLVPTEVGYKRLDQVQTAYKDDKGA
ncbi:acid protease [Cryphonectria parasitica EP155]|uniref:Acid protease n=1 Tax=Cryphonectria parasitica (strain ATCC 38755 / EP155) TaxID=660469 RepID=A0A9P4Y3K0_CRYP1|nr:acid protease [Cryphonectria parasitica EP155]KAF3765991.1 acid protease [Cryphonectria parasitica EP155]